MSFKDLLILIFKSILEIFKPSPSPTPNPEPTPNPTPNSMKGELFELHNGHRRKLGLGTLSSSTLLDRAAQKHSEWMESKGRLDHNQGNLSPGDRIRAEGYRYVTYGENIAMGYSTASRVFAGWLSSKGHRNNIENYRFRDIGIGISGRYWTVVFASASASEAEPKGLKGDE